eukprot:1649496-Rhodomonas_salina.2
MHVTLRSAGLRLEEPPRRQRISSNVRLDAKAPKSQAQAASSEHCTTRPSPNEAWAAPSLRRRAEPCSSEPTWEPTCGARSQPIPGGQPRDQGEMPERATVEATVAAAAPPKPSSASS